MIGDSTRVAINLRSVEKVSWSRMRACSRSSVFSYLPYYGRAYSVPYGGGSGLIFNAPLKEYTMDMDKKGNAVIKFSARSPEDFFEFRAKVFPDGTTSIDVTMQNRQAISYRGEVDLDKK